MGTAVPHCPGELLASRDVLVAELPVAVQRLILFAQQVVQHGVHDSRLATLDPADCKTMLLTQTRCPPDEGHFTAEFAD